MTLFTSSVLEDYRAPGVSCSTTHGLYSVPVTLADVLFICTATVNSQHCATTADASQHCAANEDVTQICPGTTNSQQHLDINIYPWECLVYGQYQQDGHTVPPAVAPLGVPPAPPPPLCHHLCRSLPMKTLYMSIFHI